MRYTLEEAKKNEILIGVVIALEKYRQAHYLDGVKVYFQNENALTIKGIRNVGGESKIVCCDRIGIKESFDRKGK